VKSEVGVPLAGGPSGAFTRERASATPTLHARTTETARDPARHPSTGPAIPVALRPLQEWLAAAVMHPEGVTASLQRGNALQGQQLDVDSVERVVLPSSTLSGLERIEIYHHAYHERLVECLADDYPALQHALGESPFEALCLAYITEHPSASPNLSFFGRRMSSFCRARPGPASAFSADLAALEWSMVEVLHEALTERLPEGALSAIPPSAWPTASFVSSHSVRVLELGYPVNAYFQAYNTDGQPSVPEPAWSATAVFRDGPTIWRMDLSRAMHVLITALFRGSSLGGALDALAVGGWVTDEDAPQVMRWFHDWVRYGFFERVVLA
jgi:hypothetical protein